MRPNLVVVNGLVESINSAKRDITVVTETPLRKKAVKVIVHMWKFDDCCPAHAGRLDWTSYVRVGEDITIKGHLGNNGRVIATSIVNNEEDDDDDEE